MNLQAAGRALVIVDLVFEDAHCRGAVKLVVPIADRRADVHEGSSRYASKKLLSVLLREHKELTPSNSETNRTAANSLNLSASDGK